MESVEKLAFLCEDMDLEVTEQNLTMLQVTRLPGRDEHGEGRVSVNGKRQLPISYVNAGAGGPMPLLKTALTTVCENNCRYCSFSCERDSRRQSFSPDELAAVFMAVIRKGYVKGLFLSSGIVGSGVLTQDKIIATGEILRHHYQYDGYLHMKIMPGAEKAQVYRAMQLADRVSINLEASTIPALNEIAPKKPALSALDERLVWINQIRETIPPSFGWKGKWPSSCTQFVVGSGEASTDADFLSLTFDLHNIRKLTRVYFSGFNPIPGTPFEDRPRQEPLRVLRLYQSAFLMRDYGYAREEICFEKDGYLDVHKDPKVSLAEKQFSIHPLEINKADYEQLLRIPGIGPKTAKVILRMRRQHTIRDAAGLRKLGVNVERAIPFVLMDGKKAGQQLSFSFY